MNDAETPPEVNRRGRIRYIAPMTVEGLLSAIGKKKEMDDNLEIAFTADMFADLCYRIIRLEVLQDQRTEGEEEG